MLLASSSAVQALPKIWGLKLRDLVGGGIGMLDAVLTQEPDGHPFKAGIHPRRAARPPRIFRRILNDGHWPCGSDYLDGNGIRFNLFDRVSAHLPESPDWLLVSLRTTFKLRHENLDEVQQAIERLLASRGLFRLHPKASCFVDHHAPGETVIPLPFADLIEALALCREPGSVALLTHLWQEALHFRDEASSRFVGYFCTEGWKAFLRRPEFWGSKLANQKRDEIVRDVRTMLEFVEVEQRLNVSHRPPMSCPFCVICPEGPVGRHAEANLVRYFDALMSELGGHPLFDARFHSTPQPTWYLETIDLLLEQIRAALGIVERWRIVGYTGRA